VVPALKDFSLLLLNVIARHRAIPELAVGPTSNMSTILDKSITRRPLLNSPASFLSWFPYLLVPSIANFQLSPRSKTLSMLYFCKKGYLFYLFSSTFSFCHLVFNIPSQHFIKLWQILPSNPMDTFPLQPSAYIQLTS
jgi:hypothetical protein